MQEALQSHSSEGYSTGSRAAPSSLGGTSALVSSCPHRDIILGGVKESCLLDTDSMVSTITESFFFENIQPWGQKRLQSCHWLQLRAANGLAIPYIGYLELDAELCGKVMKQCGVLVVRDPPGGSQPQVPGVLGMNIIRRCYKELFGEHLFALCFRGFSICHTGTAAVS